MNKGQIAQKSPIVIKFEAGKDYRAVKKAVIAGLVPATHPSVGGSMGPRNKSGDDKIWETVKTTDARTSA